MYKLFKRIVIMYKLFKRIVTLVILATLLPSLLITRVSFANDGDNVPSKPKFIDSALVKALGKVVVSISGGTEQIKTDLLNSEEEKIVGFVKVEGSVLNDLGNSDINDDNSFKASMYNYSIKLNEDSDVEVSFSIISIEDEDKGYEVEALKLHYQDLVKVGFVLDLDLISGKKTIELFKRGGTYLNLTTKGVISAGSDYDIHDESNQIKGSFSGWSLPTEVGIELGQYFGIHRVFAKVQYERKLFSQKESSYMSDEDYALANQDFNDGKRGDEIRGHALSRHSDKQGLKTEVGYSRKTKKGEILIFYNGNYVTDNLYDNVNKRIFNVNNPRHVITLKYNF